MEFFQTNFPIKKVGVNEYIIGDDRTDPIALIQGKHLIIDKVTAKNLNSIIENISGDISTISGFLPSLEETPDFEALSGKIDAISGLLPSLEETPDFKVLSGKIDAISGLLPSLEETPDFEALSGRLDTINEMLSSLEETPDFEVLSGKLDIISGLFPSLEETPDLEVLSGKLDTISGLIGNDPTISAKVNSISGLLYGLIHELDHDPFGGNLSSALGVYFSGHSHQTTTGVNINLSTLSGTLSSKIDSVSGLVLDLVHELDYDPFGGALSSALGLYFSGHNHSGVQGASPIVGTSGSFELLNITGSLMVNGIDIYPAISGFISNDSTHSDEITIIQDEIRDLETTISNLTPNGGTYSFSTDSLSAEKIQFVNFPSVFSLPPKINVSIEATGNAEIIDHIISGVNTSGYHIVFANNPAENAYRLHTIFDSNGEFAGEEAFEINDEGEVVPTNAPLVSDTMWILRNQTDLEPRNNLWRYNTGPEAFTDEISF